MGASPTRQIFWPSTPAVGQVIGRGRANEPRIVSGSSEAFSIRLFVRSHPSTSAVSVTWRRLLTGHRRSLLAGSPGDWPRTGLACLSRSTLKKAPCPSRARKVEKCQRVLRANYWHCATHLLRSLASVRILELLELQIGELSNGSKTGSIHLAGSTAVEYLQTHSSLLE